MGVLNVVLDIMLTALQVVRLVRQIVQFVLKEMSVMNVILAKL